MNRPAWRRRCSHIFTNNDAERMVYRMQSVQVVAIGYKKKAFGIFPGAALGFYLEALIRIIGSDACNTRGALLWLQ